MPLSAVNANISEAGMNGDKGFQTDRTKPHVSHTKPSRAIALIRLTNETVKSILTTLIAATLIAARRQMLERAFMLPDEISAELLNMLTLTGSL